MDEEIRQALNEVREMKQMCGNINMKLTNIVTQRGQDWKKKLEAEYQRGLNDAWEAARKIIHMPEGDLLNIFTECYSAVCTALQVLLKYDAAEAIEKLKAYEEKQKADGEIKVGDEVVWTGDEDVVIVVTRVYTVNNIEWCDGVSRDGKVYQILTEHARKTGRHFDIASILEDIRGNDNEEMFTE